MSIFRFFKRSSVFIYSIIAILVITNIFIFIFNNEVQLEKIYQNASSIHKELEYKIQEGRNAVAHLNSSGKILLEQLSDIKLANQLEYRENQDFYGLNEKINFDISKDDKANVTGFNGIKNDIESKKEIEMTLLMAPVYKAVKKQNSDYAWVYYISNKDFQTLYPYMTYDEVHYKKKYSNEPIIRYARPEFNPNKELFFTPLYFDGGGLGLMVTLGMPLYQDDKFLGTFDLDITLTSISKLLKQLDYLNNESFIINIEKQIIGANNIKGINFTTEVAMADKLYDKTLLEHSDTIGELSYSEGNYIFVGSFSNAPWKYIYYKSLSSIYLKSFLYTIPIWIFIIFLLQIKKLIIKLEVSKSEIHDMHKQTRDSINYASLIQHSLIPSNDLFRKYFSDCLIIWHPKDVVGGDIYLFEELRNENECLLMVIDCTGHGVPGAFVTMLVKAIERQIISDILNNPNEIVSPAKILSIFNKNMKHMLKQEDEFSISNAGFDGGILYYNKVEGIVKYAGAETPLFYIEDGKLNIIKGDRHSVGYKKCNTNFEYKEHIIEVKKGMNFYLTTDGYLDQNGGEKGFPFGKKKFSEIITKNTNQSYADQQEIMLYTLADYQGNEDKNDDITVIGFKI